ncbi:cytidylate kinase-like family protein [Geomonas anaerohicana]|uniref:Cytidylate kinase-like family protein n=1 Tax=Geomonas anaerohicana TaxID=2798583 RepID=A0ABS0YLL1_9BACT|nr:cytidylate kinase-like family protein [Geomonas anaerohicana]MBJ6752762.1 cytidylate kinase-like family protein [Geomonas anaerohicana]
MSKNVLIPSIEQRLRGMMEVGRRNLHEHGITDVQRSNPTVTLTREFGCEGYPVAERLQGILEKRSGKPWVVMDRALLDAVAKDHNLSDGILRNLGTKNRFLDDMLSTFSPRWRSDKDYYRLLCRQIVALATEGNVILVGRGASILTQNTGNCYHFRIIAPMSFKVKAVASRCGISADQAQDMVTEKQRQRDAFLKDFLGRDITDPTLYHLVFNNARLTAARIAEVMADVVMPPTRD